MTLPLNLMAFIICAGLVLAVVAGAIQGASK